MATKSFESEFKFNRKSAQSLAEAFDRSKRVNIKAESNVNFITSNEEIHSKFDKILKRK